MQKKQYKPYALHSFIKKGETCYVMLKSFKFKEPLKILQKWSM